MKILETEYSFIWLNKVIYILLLKYWYLLILLYNNIALEIILKDFYY